MQRAADAPTPFLVGGLRGVTGGTAGVAAQTLQRAAGPSPPGHWASPPITTTRVTRFPSALCLPCPPPPPGARVLGFSACAPPSPPSPLPGRGSQEGEEAEKEQQDLDGRFPRGHLKQLCPGLTSLQEGGTRWIHLLHPCCVPPPRDLSRPS